MNFGRALFLGASLASSHAFSASSLLTSQSLGSHAASSCPHSSTVVLSMNLFDRFKRMAESNINDEEPEKMSQSLEDIQVRLFGSHYLNVLGI